MITASGRDMYEYDNINFGTDGNNIYTNNKVNYTDNTIYQSFTVVQSRTLPAPQIISSEFSYDGLSLHIKFDVETNRANIDMYHQFNCINLIKTCSI